MWGRACVGQPLPCQISHAARPSMARFNHLNPGGAFCQLRGNWAWTVWRTITYRHNPYCCLIGTRAKGTLRKVESLRSILWLKVAVCLLRRSHFAAARANWFFLFHFIGVRRGLGNAVSQEGRPRGQIRRQIENSAGIPLVEREGNFLAACAQSDPPKRVNERDSHENARCA